MRIITTIVCAVFALLGVGEARAEVALDAASQEVLPVPAVSDGKPAAGKRVKVTPGEYAGTEVYHTLYLPEGWRKDGKRLPIVFEYTGNFHPPTRIAGW